MIKKFLIVTVFILFCCNSYSNVYAYEPRFGAGFKLGAARLEGDWNGPVLSPHIVLFVGYSPNPYLLFGSEVGFSTLRTNRDAERINSDFKQAEKLKTSIIPFDLSMRMNLMPLKRINPYSLIGVGGLWYQTTFDKELLVIHGKNAKRLNSFIKFGGGLQFKIEEKFSLLFEMDYKYTFTDRLDQIKSGDENDGVLTASIGVNYFLPVENKKDLDRDYIPLKLDIDPMQPEDLNGYMDHDGMPEGGVPVDFDYKKPLVKHVPIFEAESGNSIKYKAQVFSTIPLRVVAVLYRTVGTKNWNVLKMETVQGTDYRAVLDKSQVDASGLEYFIVAITDDLSGIGYSGLPKRPIQVTIIKNAPIWRTATRAITALGWGTASFLLQRKQSRSEQ